MGVLYKFMYNQRLPSGYYTRPIDSSPASKKIYVDDDTHTHNDDDDDD